MWNIKKRTRDAVTVVVANDNEVTLIKNENGLGFSFLMCELDPPIRDFGSLVRIKQLFPGQPAQQSGRIQEGDVLLAINGQSLKELSYPVCGDWEGKTILTGRTHCQDQAHGGAAICHDCLLGVD
uniref:PDZ domain-containing protein n=1 Tax=Neolamprologus brichardi TaxID=32507 RepID=A0A3Q4GD72_NEOBR